MKKFNTFAPNSPDFSNGYYSPKHGSPRLFVRNNNVVKQELFAGADEQPLSSGSLMKGTFQHLPSAQRQEKENNNSIEQEQSERGLYESKVSLLMSQVSISAAPRPQINARRIFTVQNNITQQILELRQQKISLMQQLSRIMDTKNLFEHYLMIATKDKEDKDTNYGSNIKENLDFDKSPKSYKSSKSQTPSQIKEDFVPIHISGPILKRNQELHLRLKELQIKQQIFGPSFQQNETERVKNQKILEQIIKIRQMNSNLKNEVASKMKNTRQNPNQQSRFVTFLPQDRQKHFDSRSTPNEYQQLQEKYNRLVTLNRDPHFQLTSQQTDYLESLRIQNRELLQQVQEMLQYKRNSPNVEELRQKIQQNEREKQIFLNQLQKFKETMRKVRQQNQNLKYELSR